MKILKPSLIVLNYDSSILIFVLYEIWHILLALLLIYFEYKRMFLCWNFNRGINIWLWHPISFLPIQVTIQTTDEKLGRMVTRVVLPRVVMHARYHYGVSNYFQKVVVFLPENNLHVRWKKERLTWWVSFMFYKVHWWLVCHDQAFSENFTGLELEDGGGRGTSGIFFFQIQYYYYMQKDPTKSVLLSYLVFSFSYFHTWHRHMRLPSGDGNGLGEMDNLHWPTPIGMGFDNGFGIFGRVGAYRFKTKSGFGEFRRWWTYLDIHQWKYHL